MSHVIIRFKVKNFEKWKPAFDRQAEGLRRAGCVQYSIYRSTSAQDQVVVFLEWTSEAHARTYFISEDALPLLREGGVLEDPDIRFMVEAEKKALTEGPFLQAV